MTGAELLARLHARGLTVAAEGTGIRIAPLGRLTEDDRALIKAHRRELLEALPSPAQAAELRRIGERLGVGGPAWAERAIRSLTRDQVGRLLSWLHRGAYQP